MRLAARWHDLGPRVATGLALLSVGALTIWMGGPAFATFIGLALGLMMWELAAMMAPGERLMSYALVPLALCAAVLPMALGWPVLLAALVLGGIITGRERWLFVAVTAAMALASFSLMGLRGSGGAVWVLWLVLVVVATDVAGYFVGRIVGGPLLWKRLSPKKTWSGAAGGWIAAACVGAIFATVTPGSGLVLIVVSVLASLASQAGDLTESALKRRAGVKDSSALLPGHGGVLDRFDGMLGAALFVLLADAVIGLPMGIE